MDLVAINSWLSANQLLVTFVIMPLVSAIAAWYSAKKAVSMSRVERMHQSNLEIARFRQAWINELRDDLSEFSGLSSVAYRDQMPIEKVERVSVLAMRIRMRMNRNDPDYDRLTTALTEMTRAYFLGKDHADMVGEPLVPLAQAILKREWDRVKSEIRTAEA